MTQSRIPIVTAYLEAAARQDLAAMAAAFTEDLVYRVPGRGPLAGTTTGQQAALDYFGAIMRLTEGSYRILEMLDWLESEERVALIAREGASRRGRSLEWTRVIVFEFRGERISAVSLFDDALHELDALLSD